MSRIRITKEFNFETGHALYGYDGKCRNVHGHSYHLSVTIIGTPITETGHIKLGMVMDFGDLKKIVNEEVVDLFDHATVFNKNSPHIELARTLESQGHRVILADYQPTSENMVIDFAERISKRLPANIQLHSLKLRETGTAYAEWVAADNPESAS
ncbi:6-pyruvoyltetrahydropterin/6-carboxytetrahydropterin synthase [Robiginitalea myxolifaciens]|uniref:6-carboxy-5,6,7,8-tetrahydropterin synthase n=1 Tax=Robiginitalea myxolifaciens TaxID=400055 RepID=A0A1I6G4P6_9FLAO|nr:6-carboxytetrahydropterin synthase [Robiginitalea myxolifaciens]SFR37178.1 6-pyruvoyltetrahydropterin/6-carboxytetrahydropterin synthase [Robiginitalea myxolifaciens]